MSIPGEGGGGCKSLVLSVSLALGKSVHPSCQPLVCHFKFLKHVLGWGWEEVRGVGVI